MLRIAANVLLVVLAAAVLAGCGSADRVEYERDLAKVGRIVDRSLEQLPQDQDEQVGPEDIRRIADDLREAANSLADLDPPQDARDPQDRLERGLRGVAGAFEQLAEDLAEAETDTQQAELFVAFASDAEVDRAFEDVVGAQEAFAEHGYRVFGAPGDAPGDEG